jgi:hypothetical protein
MLRAAIWVGILGSNIPIEEITMSTTEYKSKEGRDSFTFGFECMGHVAT